MEQKQNLPDFSKIYFWDIDIDQLDVEEDYFIILERLLNYADDRALKWVLNTYNKKQIKEVVKKKQKVKCQNR